MCVSRLSFRAAGILLQDVGIPEMHVSGPCSGPPSNVAETPEPFKPEELNLGYNNYNMVI